MSFNLKKMMGCREKLVHPITDVFFSLYRACYSPKRLLLCFKQQDIKSYFSWSRETVWTSRKKDAKAERSFSYLNDSDDVSEASFQEVAVNEHAKGETGAAVAIDQLAYEPWT